MFFNKEKKKFKKFTEEFNKIVEFEVERRKYITELDEETYEQSKVQLDEQYLMLKNNLLDLSFVFEKIDYDKKHLDPDKCYFNFQGTKPNFLVKGDVMISPKTRLGDFVINSAVIDDEFLLLQKFSNLDKIGTKKVFKTTEKIFDKRVNKYAEGLNDINYKLLKDSIYDTGYSFLEKARVFITFKLFMSFVKSLLFCTDVEFDIARKAIIQIPTYTSELFDTDSLLDDIIRMLVNVDQKIADFNLEVPIR